MSEAVNSLGTVIITGASRGIGADIARRLASVGYDLALVARNEDKLQELASSLEGAGKILVFPGDVSDPDVIDSLISRCEDELSPIYGLVNNAGITRDTLLLRMGLEAWQDVLDVNLTGTFLLTKAVARPMMRQRIGRVINISSVVGMGACILSRSMALWL